MIINRLWRSVHAARASADNQMRRCDWTKRCGAATFVLLPFLIVNEANAQSIDSSTVVIATPVYPSLDENEVILSSNTLNVRGPSVAIGDPKQGGLVARPAIIGPDAITLTGCDVANCKRSGFADTTSDIGASLVVGAPWGKISKSSTTMTVNTSNGVARFFATPSAPTLPVEYSPFVGRTLNYTTGAATVTQRDTGERMTFQASDGTKYIFLYISDKNQINSMVYSFPIQSIVAPDGSITTFTYNSALVYQDNNTNTTDYQLSSITNNHGYMIKFQNGSFVMGPSASFFPAAAVGLNLTVDVCSASAATCNLPHNWPNLISGFNGSDYSRTFTNSAGAVTTVDWTDPNSTGSPTGLWPGPRSAFPLNASMTGPNGRIRSYIYDYAYNTPRIAGIIANCPASADQNNYDFIWTFPCPFAPVTSINDGVSTSTYKLDLNFDPVPGSANNYYVSRVISTRTDQSGGTRVVTSLPSGQIISVKDELNRVTNIDAEPMFDPNEGRIKKITYPLGNSISYTYDSRGNVLQISKLTIAGSASAAFVTSYTYPTTCSNRMTCNLPLTKSDSRINVTTYEWDQNTGQLLSATMPGDMNGMRAVKRYSYTQRYAWILNGAGGYEAAGPPISMLTQTRTCRSTATVSGGCTGGNADEVVTDYYYGPQAGPNNLLLRGISTTANGVRLNTCFGYDAQGRKISETKPNANVGVCP